MPTPVKIGGFALGLAAVFTAALGLGHAARETGAVPTPATTTHGGHTSGVTPGSTGADLPAGLLVGEDGYRLTPLTGTLATSAAQPFRFQITGPDGKPVTRYTTSHDNDLHLIVVRRNLSGFQHVHPSRGGDGTWSIPLSVAAAGQYRVFADFQPAGHTGLTLGVDVPAPGDYRPVPLPVPARTTTTTTTTVVVDGYTVNLDGDLRPGRSSKLILPVSNDGAAASDLQPYLGAYGHLVALRDGDLAYLPVHPDGAPGDGRTPPGPKITFYAEVPTSGAYRLYLDFRHAGQVHTAEFTALTGPAPAAPTVTPSSSPSAGHDDGHTHG